MVDLTWREQLATGIQVVDEQHQRLLQLGRETEALLRDGTSGRVMAALADLIDYTRYHFASEEQAIALFCPHLLEKHAKEHQRLTALVLALWEKREQIESTPEELFTMICDWVVSHIIGYDLVDLRAHIET